MDNATANNTAMTETQFSQLMGEISSVKQEVSSVQREVSSVKREMRGEIRSLRDLMDDRLNSQRNWVAIACITMTAIYLGMLGISFNVVQTALNLT